MKVFSGLQLERVLMTLLSETVCGRVTWFQLEKIPISLMDKCKRMT